MQASKNKNTEKPEPFYRLSVPKQKTSSEIINEARNVLRTLRTQRPFTPTENQRKLFGSGSSLAPQNRPPSVFSVHASSFDLAESRPVSGIRLSPLDYKPVLVTCAKDEDRSISLPKPAVDAAEARKISSARAHLFRRTSQGNVFPAKMVPPDQTFFNEEKLDSEEPATMSNLCRSNDICLTEQRAYTPFNDESGQLICKEHSGKLEREDVLKGTPGNFLFQLKGERSVTGDGRFADEEQPFPCDQMRRPGVGSLWPRSAGWKRRLTGLEDETRINESEEEKIFWHMKVLPILQELKSEVKVLAFISLVGKQGSKRQKQSDFYFYFFNLLKMHLFIYILFLYFCSKLSSYDDFCAALADCSRCYVLFLALLSKHQKQQDLVIRIIFILGNLTAENNKAREHFFKEKGSLNTLISLFQTYHELDLNAEKWCHIRGREEEKQTKHPSEAEDVLIKLIRVLANLSIHPSVGATLAAAHHVVELLVTVLEYKSIDVCEELVINAATTINNLSFYKVKGSAVQDKKLHIAEMLLKLLMSNSMDGVVEAVRVFGNLSQYHEICDFIVQKKIYKFVIALLDAKNQDVCFSACGVLLNLTVDKDKRALLMEEGGIGKLVDCLRDFGPADWQLACLICKTLWNYSENITSAALCFGEDTDTLLALLTSLLDEELVLDYSLDRDLRDYHKLYWEREFKPVAEKLLDRIQSHHSFVPSVTITTC
ncbi:armadillo repeat-containing protein 2 isoform X6 [Oxyura jamaicensis]|uniref:armadillo repeat-containing protein 2 isoform X6 n=1 Tax=Oxyura jamaicensis TaxID=8884 RepID=UPI0015A6CC4F|nr:armadillo repeat-containing protein 2 isoform X6 [Oxyura jamaicensis]